MYFFIIYIYVDNFESRTKIWAFMRQNLQDKISCTHFVKYLCDETILPQP